MSPSFTRMGDVSHIWRHLGFLTYLQYLLGRGECDVRLHIQSPPGWVGGGECRCYTGRQLILLGQATRPSHRPACGVSSD